ncbi:MAG: dipeptidase [Candidatus Nanopelagicales bacterium]
MPGSPSPGVGDAAALHDLLRSAPLVDGHNDLLWELRTQVGYDFDRIDLAGHCPTVRTDLPRLRQGQVGGQFWSVWVPADIPGDLAVVATLEQLDAFHRMITRYPGDLALARTADDIERIAAGGRIACLAGVEGGHSIAGSLGVLRILRRLGAAYMTLTHNASTDWADAATDVPRHGGLTPFGNEVVREMNRLGMLVDLSHVAPDTMHDALATSSAPVIFSHSGARALCDHPRNVPDDVLAQLPRNGGVCMVTFVPGFIDPAIAEIWLAGDCEAGLLRVQHPDDPAQVAARIEAWRAAHPAPTATLAQVADHVDHVRDVSGVDHIGIGSDFDGVSVLPEGLPDVSKYPALFHELRRRGYNDDELRSIAGGNILRVMRDAQSVAGSS